MRITANPMLHNISLFVPPAQMRERSTVVTIVVALHFAVLAAWLMQPSRVSMPQHGMEVTMAVAPAAQPAPTPQLRKPEAEPKPLQLPVEPVVQQNNAPVVAVAPVVKPVEVVQPVIEPDYKASYLNNPPPPYPLAARRMGMQGKVVLNVEVLAEGVSGQVNVQQSSGHDILDNVALQTVKSWRFIPAHQAGRAITKWFKVPVQFSLKDNEA